MIGSGGQIQVGSGGDLYCVRMEFIGLADGQF